MLEFPFARVDGIELSPEISAIARRNFNILGVPGSRLEIHVGDARRFDGLDQYAYVYLYNPFPSRVFKEFMEVVFESLSRCPRELTIVYNNPQCHNEIVGDGQFQKTLDLPDRWGKRIFVYKPSAR
jgi:hypothetical protein